LTLAVLFLGLIAVVIVSGPYLGLPEPNRQHLRDRLEPPLSRNERTGEWYWLGTDHLGRDILSRTVWGARASASIAIPAVLISMVFGAGLGMLSAYRGGLLEAAAMRFVEIQLAVPFLIMALALVAVLGRSLETLVLTFAISEWPIFARTARAEVVRLRELPFMDAARSLGAGHWHILVRHVIPNASTSAVVLASLALAKITVAEASLSYLGIGIPPPTPSWGSIIADGRAYLDSAWWISAVPGLVLLLVVLAVNYIGDVVRDAIDPALAKRQVE
jgi:peptide/nickel transport system permease protein